MIIVHWSDNLYLCYTFRNGNDYTLQIIEYEVPRELEKSEDFLKYHYPLDSLEKELAALDPF